VYGLGVFSGAATSCCAPVLVGVSILSGAAASFPAALAVAFTYVAGMIAPLALLALVWERRDWGASKWLQGRQVTLRLGRIKRTMAFGTAASAFLLISMAVLSYVQAARGPGMGTGGWLLKLAANLQHFSAVITSAMAWVPGWVVALLLVFAAFFVIRQSLKLRHRPQVATNEPASQTRPDCCSPTATTANVSPEESRG